MFGPQQIDLTIHLSPSVEKLLLHQFEDLKNSIKRMEKRIMSELTDLTAAVTENSTVIGSAIVLINGLAAKIEQIKTDPAALSALATELRGKSSELGAAVSANTSADEEPQPDPAPARRR